MIIRLRKMEQDDRREQKSCSISTRRPSACWNKAKPVFRRGLPASVCRPSACPPEPPPSQCSGRAGTLPTGRVSMRQRAVDHALDVALQGFGRARRVPP
ncbi:MAG: hypothetical protein ACRC67_39500 [Inquilinus sp.]|uniref:hypothetical protein n=1 Tax=Inquilinus sp. TaxID=1932117 RepID=UPI003F3726BE